MVKINSLSLPYFSKDTASIFLLNENQIKVPVSCFQDATTEGGRFHQFYTFLLGGNKKWFQKKPKDG